MGSSRSWPPSPLCWDGQQLAALYVVSPSCPCSLAPSAPSSWTAGAVSLHLLSPGLKTPKAPSAGWKSSCLIRGGQQCRCHTEDCSLCDTACTVSLGAELWARLGPRLCWVWAEAGTLLRWCSYHVVETEDLFQLSPTGSHKASSKAPSPSPSMCQRRLPYSSLTLQINLHTQFIAQVLCDGWCSKQELLLPAECASTITQLGSVQ